MRAAVLTCCIVILLVIAPELGRSGTRQIVHRIDLRVREAQGCERKTDRDRPPTPSRRTYARSHSPAFRAWAHRLWLHRARHACWKVRYLNALPPRAIRYVFQRTGQAETALTVAGREAGSDDIWAHPYCTRAVNVRQLGCFQMGPWARARYGHGPTALEQAWAAFAYVREFHGWCSGWAATAPGC